MFIFGTRSSTTRVEGGLEQERHCQSCRRTTRFVEVRKNQNFTAYFTPVFSVGAELLLQCPVCGEAVPSDRAVGFVESQAGTALGAVAGAAASLGETEVVSRAVEAVRQSEVEGAARDLVWRGGAALGKLAEQAGAGLAGRRGPREEWRSLHSLFQSQVPDREARVRLWRLRRARYSGEFVELEQVTDPSSEDLSALRSLVRLP
ncbi:MAG: hypothetical protein ACI9K2_006300 [Myxococcota bacterium]|jgi:hypothetical protein